MTTATLNRVTRDRRAESIADDILRLAARFGDQVPAEKLGHALRIVGWRAGADAVNRANDPNCGQPSGWEHRTFKKLMKGLDDALGRKLTVAETMILGEGFTGAIAAGN